MMKSHQNFVLILKNLELHNAQFKILQKIKKDLTCHKIINQELLTFTKAYFQKS